MPRVLMVCTANICRSPIAETIGLFLAASRGLAREFQFASAGIDVPWPGAPADERAREALLRHGYPSPTTRARSVSPDDFLRHDLILAMEHRHVGALHRMAPVGHAARIGLLLDWHRGRHGQDVPDPYFNSDEGFDHVLALCETAVESVLASSA